MKHILLLCIAILFSGCGDYIALPKDTTRSAHNRIKKQVKDGLIIAAEDYSEYRRCRRYFYRDLLDLGYIPIYICLGNQSESEFIVRKEKIRLLLEDTTELSAVDVKEVIDEAGGSDELDQDYSQKAFYDSYIRRGDNLFGFLFFKVPGQKKISLQGSSLQVIADKKAEAGQQGETLKVLVIVDTD